jgi:hypothetical protein
MVLSSVYVRSAPGRGDVAAFVLASIGVLVAIWLVVASDGDPSQVLWPLVLAPVGITLAPVLAPRTDVRLSALLVLGAWCFLTGFSIGFLLLPTLGALLASLVQEER